MSNEPKNPYEKLESYDLNEMSVQEIASYRGKNFGWESCDTAWREYLRSLVGEKGREEIAKILDEFYIWRSNTGSYVGIKGSLEQATNSLAPIIGAQIAAGVEEEIKKRGLVKPEHWSKGSMKEYGE